MFKVRDDFCEELCKVIHNVPMEDPAGTGARVSRLGMAVIDIRECRALVIKEYRNTLHSNELQPNAAMRTCLRTTEKMATIKVQEMFQRKWYAMGRQNGCMVVTT